MPDPAPLQTIRAALEERHATHPKRPCDICAALAALDSLTDGVWLESCLRDWLEEEDRQAREAREAAESYRGVDVEAAVDLSRSANRHEATARKIRRVLLDARLARQEGE